MFLENRTYDRIRYTVSTNSDGERVITQQQTDTFHDGSIQPMPEEEIEQIDGLDRSDNIQKLITSHNVRGPDQHQDLPADEIMWDGKTWTVKKVLGGFDALIPHHSVVMVHEQE